LAPRKRDPKVLADWCLAEQLGCGCGDKGVLEAGRHVLRAERRANNGAQYPMLAYG